MTNTGKKEQKTPDKNQFRMKIIGKRKPPTVTVEAADGFLKLGLLLRGGKPFIPKGVHRFKTFEESQQWTLKMITRRPSQDFRR